MSLGLVLEGGGMRGIFTAGVLDYFLEKELQLPYVIGVSAGANNGMSYVSKQYKRNKSVNLNFIDDKRFLSYENLLKSGSMFGMDFIFNEIPNELEIFDYDTFFKSDMKYILGVTNIETGEEEYYDKNIEREDFLKYLRASSSLPFIAHKVTVKGKNYMDGGIHDPIPIKKSIEDGNNHNIVILTQPIEYKKEAFKFGKFTKFYYKKYPEIKNLLETRHTIYNETKDMVDQLELEKKAFVFRPSGKITIGRMEKDKDILEAFYNEGYEMAKEKYQEMMDWINM